MRDLIIQAAQSQLGNRDPNRYWKDVWILGGPHPPHWCGGFTLWCLHQAKVALDINWEFNPPYYGFLYRLPRTDKPLVGDIAYFQKHQHHAVVQAWDGELFWTIDGNATTSAKDPLPPRVIEKERYIIGSNVTFYSIKPWLPNE